MFRYKNLFLCFSSLQAFRAQSLLNPFPKCHYQTNPPSSLFQYLQTSLGFPRERALIVSQQLKDRKLKNPDSVVTFFKSHGLSETQIRSIINRVPVLLFYDPPESRFRPIIQFFKERGISESDLVALMVSSPSLFTRSLEKHIKPILDLLRSILGTDEFAVQLLIRSKLIFNPHHLSTNLTILRNCSIQNHHLCKLFKYQPLVLVGKPDRLNEVVEMVKGMGFKPQSYSFAQAVFTIVGTARRTWDAKFKIYTSLGWSAEEIQYLFRKHPPCMQLSEEKIRKGFDYLTKELGWVPSFISIYPTVLSLSLEKRIIPRHRFLQFLSSKGFIKKDKMSANSFIIGEKRFLKKFVIRYESEVPDILKIYGSLIQSKLLNIRDGKDCNVH